MGQLRAELDFTSVDTVIRSGLHEYLDRLQLKMNAIDNSLRDDFAVRMRASMTQTQSQSQSQVAAEPESALTWPSASRSTTRRSTSTTGR